MLRRVWQPLVPHIRKQYVDFLVLRGLYKIGAVSANHNVIVLLVNNQPWPSTSMPFAYIHNACELHTRTVGTGQCGPAVLWL